MKSLFLGLFLLLPTLLFAQQEGEQFEAALLQTKTGAMIIYNGPHHAFSVRAVGTVVPPTKETPNFLTVNGQILQATIIPYASNGDVTNLDEATMKKALIGYQQYESSYFKDELKVPVTNEKTSFTHIGNHLFLAWEFDTHFSGKNKVVRQVYLVSICFNQALVLNCPIMKVTETAKAKALLAATAATLELKDAPIDLTELYHKLEKE